MADFKNIILPGMGGMNSDTHPMFMGKNDSPYFTVNHSESHFIGVETRSLPFGIPISQLHFISDGHTLTSKPSGAGNVKKIHIAHNAKFICYIIDNGVCVSKNYGRDIKTISFPNIGFDDIHSSKDGRIVLALSRNNNIYISYDYGETWGTTATPRSWSSCCVSGEGNYMYASVNNNVEGGTQNDIYISTNAGATWYKSIAPSKRYSKIRCSASGLYVAAYVMNSNEMLLSLNAGNTWTSIIVPTLDPINDLDVSYTADVIAVASGVEVAVTEDYGESWRRFYLQHECEFVAVGMSDEVIYGYGGQYLSVIKNGYAKEYFIGKRFVDIACAKKNKIVRRYNMVPDESGSPAVKPIHPVAFIYPSHDAYRAIGGCNDYESDSFIVAKIGLQGCEILKINKATTLVITRDVIWNFNENYLVKMRVVGSGDDRYLVMTDGLNEPRCVNIKKLEENYYPSLHHSIIDLAKPSPIAKIDYDYIIAEGKMNNNIMNRVFQFAYTYIYDDRQKSGMSDISPVVYWKGFNTVIMAGVNTMLSDLNTTAFIKSIALTIPVDYTNVVKIELYVREPDNGIGSPGLWGLYDTIPAAYPSTTYEFYNDKVASPIDTDMHNTYLDVPRKATAMEVIKNNRIVLGGVTKGFNNQSVLITSSIQLYFDNIIDGSVERITVANHIGKTLKNMTRYAPVRISIVSETQSKIETYVYEGVDFATDADFHGYIATDINSRTQITGITLSVGTGGVIFTNISGGILNAISAYSVSKTLRHFKTNTRLYYGIVYYDKKRRMSTVMRNESDVIETGGMTSMTNLIRIITTQFIISHSPPEWATEYNIFITQPGKFFQIPMIVGSAKVQNETIDLVKEGAGIRLHIGQMVNRVIANNPAFNIGLFTLKKGDRVRVISHANITKQGTTTTTLKTEWSYFTPPIEGEIIGVDGDESVLITDWSANEKWRESAANIDIVMVEFYRPTFIDDADSKYMSIGQPQQISNNFHLSSNGSSQTTNGFADIQLYNEGNCYLYAAEFFQVKYQVEGTDIQYLPIIAYVESMSVSPMYQSKNNGFGSFSIVDEDAKEKKYRHLAYGGTLSLDGMRFNELGRFTHRNVALDIDDSYGEITDLIENGNSLVVVQENKISTCGIGINEITQPDGTTILVANDSVLGMMRPAIEIAGCRNQGAIVKNNRSIYFPDIIRGKVYRKSSNGIEPISDYGMEKYFKEKFNKLASKGLEWVHMAGVWDAKYGIYLLTMGDRRNMKGASRNVDNRNEYNTETIGFYEKGNFWFSFYGFTPELYGTIGSELVIGFKIGDHYYHGQEGAINIVYGEQNRYELSIVANENPLIVKRFLSIEQNADNPLGSDDDYDIIIDPNNKGYTEHGGVMKYNASMASTLNKRKYKYREGVYKAEFMNDGLVKNIFNDINLIKGRGLRGKSMVIIMRGDTPVDMHGVVVNSVISR